MLTIYRRGRVFWLRGSIAGQRLHRSTRTTDRDIAEQIRIATESREWKRSLFGAEAVLTFAQAAALYLDAEKSTRFLAPIVAHFKDMPIRQIKPGMITQAAHTLYPKAGPATRNRQVISPAQAVINHAAEAGLCQPIRVKRFPIQKTDRAFASLEWVEVFSQHATSTIAALSWFMFLTGTRISSATKLTCGLVQFHRDHPKAKMPRRCAGASAADVGGDAGEPGGE
jgi:hypothetical protein